MTAYRPADDRYERMQYRRAGASGFVLPAISLGLWQNFGDDRPYETQRAIVRAAFDHGISHMDLANNYGPPHGAAESNFGRMLAEDLRGHRDELLISTKAGYGMWAGPYGQGGSRKHILASLDQSLERLGVEYVDVFYAHRADADTPLEVTAAALARAVESGKALSIGVSSFSPTRTRRLTELLMQASVPVVLHQPSYSIFNRWIEREDLLETTDDLGMGCVTFSPLAQGLLTDRYLHDVPADSRATRGGSLRAETIDDDVRERLRGLNALAAQRGQTLAQMALSWNLRDPRVTSVLVGASSVAQLEANLGALSGPDFTAPELTAVDRLSDGMDVDLWSSSRAL